MRFIPYAIDCGSLQAVREILFLQVIFTRPVTRMRFANHQLEGAVKAKYEKQ